MTLEQAHELLKGPRKPKEYRSDEEYRDCLNRAEAFVTTILLDKKFTGNSIAKHLATMSPADRSVLRCMLSIYADYEIEKVAPTGNPESELHSMLRETHRLFRED